MLKKSVTYTDLNGVESTDEYYFHFNKAEIFDFNKSVEGGFADRLAVALDTKNTTELVYLFQKLILASVGYKSADGKTFEKEDGEFAKKFAKTEAYGELFMELATDPDAAKQFIDKVMPDMSKYIQDMPNALPAASIN